METIDTSLSQKNVGAEPRSSGSGSQLGRIRERLSREVGEQRFERYFAKQTRLSVSDGCLDVTVPSRFLAELLDRRFGGVLREAARAELAGSPVGIDSGDGESPLKFRVDSGAFERTENVQRPRAQTAGEATVTRRPAQAAATPVRSRASTLQSRYRLDDFVVGSANKLAYGAAVRLAESASGPGLTRLFIQGRCGLGKTHLLNGIAAMFARLNPGKTIRYITAEEFTNEYITAVKANKLDAFRKMYRAVDLLCLDDAHFLSRKEKTQSELLHTFDSLDLDGARLAIASDEHPRDIEKLSEQLVSRFLSGAVVRLEEPDDELRDRMVRAFARKRSMTVEEEAVRMLVSASARCDRTGLRMSVRQIEGLMTQVEAVCKLMPEFAPGGTVGVAAVRRALGREERSDQKTQSQPSGRPIAFPVIVSEVCSALRVDSAAFTGRSRHFRVVMARSLCSYFGRTLTTLSFPEIAKFMGRPTHTTIISASRRIAARLVQEAAPGGSAVDLGPELGAEFAGTTLAELCERLAKVIARSSDRV